MSQWDRSLRKLDEFRWEISPDYKTGMRVPDIVYADDVMMQSIKEDQSLEQVTNVAFLPCIVKYFLAMPDIHCGDTDSLNDLIGHIFHNVRSGIGSKGKIVVNEQNLRKIMTDGAE